MLVVGRGDGPIRRIQAGFIKPASIISPVESRQDKGSSLPGSFAKKTVEIRKLFIRNNDDFFREHDYLDALRSEPRRLLGNFTNQLSARFFLLVKRMRHSYSDKSDSYGVVSRRRQKQAGPAEYQHG
jgi:hypothetical protein